MESLREVLRACHIMLLLPFLPSPLARTGLLKSLDAYVFTEFAKRFK